MRIELGNESSPNICECCGNETKTVYGYAYQNDIPLAAYYVQWTCSRADHPPNFDFLIGTWGNDGVHDKVLVSWIYQSNLKGGCFMVVDSHSRPAASSSLCAKPLSRDEVINNSGLMGVCAEMLDKIWLDDPRISEIITFGRNS